MAPAAILIGGGLMAASQIQQGRIAEAQGRFAEQISLRNQAALERQDKAEKAASRMEEERIVRKEKIFKAAQRARIGKQATGLAGATLAALTDTAAQFSIERNLALRRGFVRGRELVARGHIIAAQGRWAGILGAQAKRLSYVQATGSILGSVGMASYYKTAAATGTTGVGTTVAPAPFTPSTYPGVGLVPMA